MMHSALGVRAAAVPGAWPMAAREMRTATYAGAPAERSLRRLLSMGGPIVASQKSLGAAAATPARCLWPAGPRSALSCLPRGISPSPCAHARIARWCQEGARECSASVLRCRRRSLGVLSRADSIVKLEALRKEDPARVIAIWMEYHASKVLRRCASTLPKPYLSHLIVTHRRISARRGAVEGGACIYIV